MATNTSPKPPSFVFEYLPKKATVAPATAESSSPSLYDRTSTFLSSFTKALTQNPQLSLQQQRLATLQQAKTGIENHMMAKRKAGIAVSASENEDALRIEKAIQGLAVDA